MSTPPEILDLPVGLTATGTRTENDPLGQLEVPADHYWGAQTQRSLIHFDIGDDRMPKEVYHAYGYVKKAAAIVNGAAGRLPRWKVDLIARVADEVIGGALDTEFPLYVWQTGSGTQSNMNVNEVISNRAIQLLGGRLGGKDPIHPNDHVNMGQSSNDTFVSAMHIAAVEMIETRLLPALDRLRKAAQAKSHEWEHVVKIGRTHLEDATPLTVGQEWSGYAAQLADATDHLRHVTRGLYPLAIGGTAVGTGLNAPPGFGDDGPRHRQRDGHAVIARLSLARTARLLTDHPGSAPGPAFGGYRDADYAPEIEDTAWGPALRLHAPVRIEGAPLRWDRPACDLGTAEAAQVRHFDSARSSGPNATPGSRRAIN